MKEKKENYSRRKFIKTVGASTAAIPLLNLYADNDQLLSEMAPQFEKIPGSEKPNIIFILSDDHRYDFMSFNGGPDFLKTPGLDEMANEGVHFQNTFVTTSLCSPSRASILTGMYSHKHKVVDNDSPVPPENIFFP